MKSDLSLEKENPSTPNEASENLFPSPRTSQNTKHIDTDIMSLKMIRLRQCIDSPTTTQIIKMEFVKKSTKRHLNIFQELQQCSYDFFIFQSKLLHHATIFDNSTSPAGKIIFCTLHIYWVHDILPHSNCCKISYYQDWPKVF